MRFCPTCRRPRAEGAKTCGGCGRTFPTGLASLPDTLGSRRAGAVGAARALLKPRSAAVVIAVVVIAVILIAGATGAVWLVGRHGRAHAAGPGSSPAARAGPTSPAAAQPASRSSTAAAQPASSSSTAANAGPGALTVSAAAAQDPAESSVATLLASYFAAINSHDYGAYQALFVPQMQQNMTQASFDSGYQGTADSAERLVSISTAADGDTQAAVTFTSNQRPDAADSYEACTNWQVSLFLAQQGGGGYLIDVAPPGYHAASAVCP
jgi:hypothetical protein